MREVYLGIDPGTKGFVCIYNAIDKKYTHCPLESEDLMRTLSAYSSWDAIAVVEKVGAMPGQGRSSIFTFGYNVGRVIGILEALAIPYELVSPQRWQREIWDSRDKVAVGGKVDSKKTSYQAARRLHPAMSFLRTDKCKKFDDNMVDSTLICDYAIRKNL